MRQHPPIQDTLRRISLLAVLLLAAFLRLRKLGTSPFGFDAAVLSNLAALFLDTGIPPAQGMISSIGVNNPPLAVYIFSLPMLFTRDPVLLNGFVALVNVIGVWGCYALVRRHWGAWPALVAALFRAARGLACPGSCVGD